MSVRSGKWDRKGRELRLEVQSRQRKLGGDGECDGTEVGEGISRTGVDKKGWEEEEVDGGNGEEGGVARCEFKGRVLEGVNAGSGTV